jgi:hypothetical protein
VANGKPDSMVISLSFGDYLSALRTLSNRICSK